MDRPNECKWCGCGVHHRYPQAIIYKCWSSQQGSVWERSLECQIGVAEKRIQRAVEVLEGQDRIIMVLDDDDEDVVSATGVDRAIEILKGEEDDGAD